MSTYNSITNFFETRGPEDVERFVDKNLDISQQVYALIKSKGLKNQNELAKMLGKSNAEVSKWLSGTHNLTLRSIAKMEAALDADIIMTPLKAEKQYKRIEYVKLKIHANKNNTLPDNTNYQEAIQDIKTRFYKTKISVVA